MRHALNLLLIFHCYRKVLQEGNKPSGTISLLLKKLPAVFKSLYLALKCFSPKKWSKYRFKPPKGRVRGTHKKPEKRQNEYTQGNH